MTTILRTSEFWMAVAAALGQVGVAVGFWTQEHFNGILMPTLTYIIARITSKVAKATIATK